MAIYVDSSADEAVTVHSSTAAVTVRSSSGTSGNPPSTPAQRAMPGIDVPVSSSSAAPNTTIEHVESSLEPVVSVHGSSDDEEIDILQATVAATEARLQLALAKKRKASSRASHASSRRSATQDDGRGMALFMEEPAPDHPEQLHPGDQDPEHLPEHPGRQENQPRGDQPLAASGSSCTHSAGEVHPAGPVLHDREPF